MRKGHNVPIIAVAAMAAAGTAWYLWPFGPNILGNLLAGWAVLALPLWRWLPTERYSRIAVAWMTGGLLGAYFFGTLIFAAGALTAIGTAARRCLRTVV